MNIFCPHCGELINESVRFCPRCGKNPRHILRSSNYTLGKSLRTISMVIFILVCIYGLILDLSVLNALFGFSGVVAGFFFSPLVVALIPIYLFINGYWLPAVFIYGGGIVCAVLDNKGKQLTGEKD